MKKVGKYSKLFYENNKPGINTGVNTCICCGEIIPEGALVCIKCEIGWTEYRCAVCGKSASARETVCSKCVKSILHFCK